MLSTVEVAAQSRAYAGNADEGKTEEKRHTRERSRSGGDTGARGGGGRGSSRQFAVDLGDDEDDKLRDISSGSGQGNGRSNNDNNQNSEEEKKKRSRRGGRKHRKNKDGDDTQNHQSLPSTNDENHDHEEKSYNNINSDQNNDVVDHAHTESGPPDEEPTGGAGAGDGDSGSDEDGLNRSSEHAAANAGEAVTQTLEEIDPSLPQAEKKKTQGEQVRHALANEKNQFANHYKTRLCKVYQSGETCMYGDRCRFAHGKAQIRTYVQNQRDGLTSEEAVQKFVLAGGLSEVGRKQNDELAQQNAAAVAAGLPMHSASNRVMPVSGKSGQAPRGASLSFPAGVLPIGTFAVPGEPGMPPFPTFSVAAGGDASQGAGGLNLSQVYNLPLPPVGATGTRSAAAAALFPSGNGVDPAAAPPFTVVNGRPVARDGTILNLDSLTREQLSYLYKQAMKEQFKDVKKDDGSRSNATRRSNNARDTNEGGNDKSSLPEKRGSAINNNNNNNNSTGNGLERGHEEGRQPSPVSPESMSRMGKPGLDPHAANFTPGGGWGSAAAAHTNTLGNNNNNANQSSGGGGAHHKKSDKGGTRTERSGSAASFAAPNSPGDHGTNRNCDGGDQKSAHRDPQSHQQQVVTGAMRLKQQYVKTYFKGLIRQSYTHELHEDTAAVQKENNEMPKQRSKHGKHRSGGKGRGEEEEERAETASSTTASETGSDDDDDTPSAPSQNGARSRAGQGRAREKNQSERRASAWEGRRWERANPLFAFSATAVDAEKKKEKGDKHDHTHHTELDPDDPRLMLDFFTSVAVAAQDMVREIEDAFPGTEPRLWPCSTLSPSHPTNSTTRNADNNNNNNNNNNNRSGVNSRAPQHAQNTQPSASSVGPPMPLLPLPSHNGASQPVLTPQQQQQQQQLFLLHHQQQQQQQFATAGLLPPNPTSATALFGSGNVISFSPSTVVVGSPGDTPATTPANMLGAAAGFGLAAALPVLANSPPPTCGGGARPPAYPQHQQQHQQQQHMLQVGAQMVSPMNPLPFSVQPPSMPAAAATASTELRKDNEKHRQNDSDEDEEDTSAANLAAAMSYAHNYFSGVLMDTDSEGEDLYSVSTDY